MRRAPRTPLPDGCKAWHEWLALGVSLVIVAGVWVAYVTRDGRVSSGEGWSLVIGLALVVLMFVTGAHRCIRATAPRNRR